ncbi:MAG: EAL domain-containing protein [Chromatiaceae bacterium]|jgi:EAL domain-containing protein (putative c-di-GMP-specific phosphodiesterase class I)/ActR/RegA family two-component response regulator
MMSHVVCMIDDDPDYLQMCSQFLASADIAVQGFTCLHDAADAVCQAKVVILDLDMPHIDGVETLRWLSRQAFSGHLVIVSGHDISIVHAARELAKAQGLQVADALTKPLDMQAFSRKIQQLLQVQLQPKAGTGNQPAITAADLVAALQRNELSLCYQPKYQLTDNKLVGFEALARWKSPLFGQVPPTVFIQLAEQSGVIDALTDWVLAEVIAQLSCWAEQKLSTCVAVNLSLINLQNINFPARLLHELKCHQLQPQQLVLELTESAFMNEVVTALDILIRLRMNGIELSIDDFGTGYSSLAQLQRIPFTELKIDRRFIANFLHEAESQAIVETCINLAHKMHIRTVAEGVETAETLQALQAIGCDYAQGYFFHPPLTVLQATELLKAVVL